MTNTLLPHYQLPGQFGAAVIETRDATQAPIELVTAVALAAASIAVQHTCLIQRIPGLVRPTSLYLFAVCGSGERKSAVQNLLFKGIDTSQKLLLRTAHEEAEHVKAEHFLWRERVKLARDQLKRAARKCMPLEAHENRLHELAMAEPKPAKPRRLNYVDTTPQALVWSMHESGNCAGLVLDEFGQFINSAMASQLPLLNSLWDGSDVPVDRKTSDSFILTNPRLTCLFQAQPEVFRNFMIRHGQQALGNGFLSRMLLAFPVSTQGWRAETYEVVCPKLDWFYERCETLLTKSEPRVLRFSPAAQARWHNAAAYYEQQMQPGGAFQDMKDYASKMAENAARMAAVLHAFEADDSDEIQDDVLFAAIQLVGWYAHQYRQLLDQSDPVAEKQRKAADLYNWIFMTMMNKNWNWMYYSQLMQYGPNFARKKAALEELLGILVHNGQIAIGFYGRRKVISMGRSVMNYG